jgi:hypothetical protein
VVYLYDLRKDDLDGWAIGNKTRSISGDEGIDELDV